MKSYISYTPHGINHKNFYPIDELHPQYKELQTFKKTLLKGQEYDFVLLFNSRNIRRKSIPDTLLAFKTFLDTLTPEQADKCCIVLHTQPVDDNGTDLYAVREMLFGERAEHHVIFSQGPVDGKYMNFLYNISDGVILLSSNEGWGLSITEGIMCGKMIIANVTGGLQDQMRFEDKEGNWIRTSERFSSNHLGRYVKHGAWAIPVFPSNLSLQGSPVTPYILDDRCSPFDAAKAIGVLYDMSPSFRKDAGFIGRTWLLSDEAKMSAEKMCDNIINSIDQVFAEWEPRESHQIIKIDKRKKRHVKYPISY